MPHNKMLNIVWFRVSMEIQCGEFLTISHLILETVGVLCSAIL